MLSSDLVNAHDVMTLMWGPSRALSLCSDIRLMQIPGSEIDLLASLAIPKLIPNNYKLTRQLAYANE